MHNKEFILSHNDSFLSGKRIVVNLDDCDTEKEVVSYIGQQLYKKLYKEDVDKTDKLIQMIKSMMEKSDTDWHCHDHPSFADWLLNPGPFYLCQVCGLLKKREQEKQDLIKKIASCKDLVSKKVMHLDDFVLVGSDAFTDSTRLILTQVYQVLNEVEAHIKK